MAKLDLTELKDIDGFMAVAVVDSTSGLAMAIENTTNLDLDLAAAGNSEVLNSKIKTAKTLGITGGIEDILITLNTQYHLLRPLHGNKELFMYLLLDKSKANLAMARHQLKGFETNLDFS